jgi:hypothetical protein
MDLSYHGNAKSAILCPTSIARRASRCTAPSSSAAIPDLHVADGGGRKADRPLSAPHGKMAEQAHPSDRGERHMAETIEPQTRGPSGAKKYAGGCQCGAVRYEIEIDLSADQEKCNCPICTETNFWGAIVRPNAFRLLSGTESLTNCRFNSKAPYFFCKYCDVRSFCRGDIEQLGGEVYSVNLNCLDDVNLGMP